MSEIRVTDLFCYPIKSCAGTRLETTELTQRGMAHDRTLMLVRPNGDFVTQREHPTLCLVKPAVLSCGAIQVTARSRRSVELTPTFSGPKKRVSIWSDRVDAVVQSAEANGWFSDYLGFEVELVAMHSDTRRRVDPDYARSGEDVVSFADGFSMLLISRGSLDYLNQKLDDPVPMDRFRPNIVVSGCEPHAEDFWRDLTIGDVSLSGVKPCARCSMIGVEQTTGERGVQPASTLAKYRKFLGGVMFGMNLVHQANGTLSVGDEVVVQGVHEPDWFV